MAVDDGRRMETRGVQNGDYREDGIKIATTEGRMRRECGEGEG
jgi:hypothetical protein